MKRQQPGYYLGKHYTAYIQQMRDLKKEEKHSQLETLLINLIAATESEAYHQQCLAAPAYYEELAILYRKLHRDADERAVLERFFHLPAHLRTSARLETRLAKIKAKEGK